MRRSLVLGTTLVFALTAGPAQAHNGFKTDPKDSGIPKFMDIVRIRHEQKDGSQMVKLIIRSRRAWTRQELAQYAGGPSWSPSFFFAIGQNAGVSVWVNKQAKLQGRWYEFGNRFETGRMRSAHLFKPGPREVGIKVWPEDWNLPNPGASGTGVRWKATTGLHEVTYDKTKWLRHNG